MLYMLVHKKMDKVTAFLSNNIILAGCGLQVLYFSHKQLLETHTHTHTHTNTHTHTHTYSPYHD